MNGTDLLQGLKEATSTENFDNISDDKYYKWISWSHTKIAEYIKAKIDSKFFMGISQADLIYGQTLYDNIGKDPATGLMINVIDSIYVKYDGSRFQKVTIGDISEMPESREYYQEKQPISKAFCTITGQKVIFYPTPKIDLTNGIEVIGSRDVADITALTTAEQIFNGVLKEYHNEIIKGAEQYVYKFLQEFDKEAKVRNEFTYEDLERMKTEISFRGSQPLQYEEPDLSYLLN